KDGYLVNKSTGCKYSCIENINDSHCNEECISSIRKGSYGYCYKFYCYCIGMPDSTQVYPIPGKTCSTE
uniref:Toxin Cg2 n=1 Tax=Centruroides gracilis TaxID=217898 RepID=SCX2_CENGR|nr:RecName: Full=Toxin Cg2 [Centruroides gracilis]